MGYFDDYLMNSMMSVEVPTTSQNGSRVCTSATEVPTAGRGAAALLRVTAAALLGIAVQAACVSALAQAGKRPIAGDGWRFERAIDKITDGARCRLESPQGKKLVISFRDHGAAFLTSGEPLILRDGGTLTARVDKNAAIEMYVHNVAPPLARVDRNDDWLNQMGAGQVLFVRVVSGITVNEDYSLHGFKGALAAYRRCLAEQ